MQKLKIFIIVLVLFSLATPACFSANKEEESFIVASKAFSDGFYEASSSLFKRFIEEFPQSEKSYQAKLYIAKCYYFKENYSRSLEMLNELIGKKETENMLDEIYYWLAEVYFKGKNFNNSFGYANKIIESYLSSKFIWEAHYLAGTSLLELNQAEQAEQFFDNIIKKCNDKNITESSYSQLLKFYFQKKDYSRLISLGEKYLKNYPKSALTARVYFYLGESHYALRELDKAVSNYQRALELSSDVYLNDLIRQGLGFSFIAKENSQEAKKVIDEISDRELRIFSQGVYYFKVQDYAKALESFDSVLKEFPQGKIIANVYLNKADTFYEMGRINDSLYAYNYVLNNFRGIQYSDIFDKAHYGLAWCYLKSGEFKKAIDEFKNTLKYTDNPIVMVSSQIQIADAYQEADNYSQALDIYNEILRNNPNTVYTDYIQFQIGMVFLKTKRLEESLLALKNLQKNFPSSKLIPQAQYYLAVGYFSIENYREAEDLLEDFIKKFPQSEFMPKVHYLYGKCFFNEKNYDKALEVFRGMIGKFNDREIDELVYIDIGNCYLNLSMFDKAKKIWEEFLIKFGQSQYAGSVALYLGGLYEKEENSQEAEKYYKKVIDNYAESIWAKEAMLSLGHLYWSKGDLEKAEIYFKKLESLDSPLAFKSKLYLAEIYSQKGMSTEALKIYDELIDSTSEVSKLAILEKAFLLKDLKEYASAVPLFRKSVEGGIDSAKIRFSLGMCLEKLNQNKEAIDEYFKVTYGFSSADNEDYKVKAYFRIAKIYEKENKTDAAKEIYKKIIGSDSEESKIAGARLKELEESNSK